LEPDYLENSKKTNNESYYPADYRILNTPASNSTTYKPFYSASPNKKSLMPDEITE